MAKQLERHSVRYDVVVVGGGMSGLCAALASARHGAKTALIQNRPVLGGNASGEIRMHICGADCHGTRPEARETGILEEILLENKRINPQTSYSIFDTLLWEKAAFQPNLDLFLNTHMFDVEMDSGKLGRVFAVQLTTEKMFEFRAGLFVDATGDGMLSYLAGAAYMSGREGRDVFGESIAPQRGDHITMGNSLMFTTRDAGHPVPFVKPEWAHTFTEEQMRFRDHGSVDSGYWWIELGGDQQDVIKDGELLRDELLKSLYGVWDHIKNGGDHGADNLVLDWVGMLPGKRESRRVVGDYVLVADDLLCSRAFPDAVAYGGWPMDMHVEGGLQSKSDEPTTYFEMDDVYSIPYRCLYARDIDNLMLAGRNISVSHMAFGSTRDMATTSVVGQAVGTAAAMAIAKRVSPRELGSSAIAELQQALLKDDCFIPGIANQDPADVARGASVSASSALAGAPAENVINGVHRNGVVYPEGWSFDDYRKHPEAYSFELALNGWISEPLGAGDAWLRLDFPQPVRAGELRVTFDSNLSKEIMPTIITWHRGHQLPGAPPQLVKDFDVEFFLGGQLIRRLPVRGNGQRHWVAALDPLDCDAIRINILSTNGDPHARVFEVRVY